MNSLQLEATLVSTDFSLAFELVDADLDRRIECLDSPNLAESDTTMLPAAYAALEFDKRTRGLPELPLDKRLGRLASIATLFEYYGDDSGFKKCQRQLRKIGYAASII